MQAPRLVVVVSLLTLATVPADARRRKGVCSSQPCQNDGQCIDLSGPGGEKKFECSCMAGYEGLTCQKRVDPCARDPCLNGGVCEAKGDIFHCICSEDFQGASCEKAKQKKTPCSNKPCDPNGVCEIVNDGYVCQCFAGFHGPHCQQHTKQNLKVIASQNPEITEYTVDIRGMLIAMMVFVGGVLTALILLAFHCCRVYSMRSTLRAILEAKKAAGKCVDLNAVPGWFEISNDLCYDFFCCFCKRRVDSHVAQQLLLLNDDDSIVCEKREGSIPPWQRFGSQMGPNGSMRPPFPMQVPPGTRLPGGGFAPPFPGQSIRPMLSSSGNPYSQFNDDRRQTTKSRRNSGESRKSRGELFASSMNLAMDKKKGGSGSSKLKRSGSTSSNSSSSGSTSTGTRKSKGSSKHSPSKGSSTELSKSTPSKKKTDISDNRRRSRRARSNHDQSMNGYPIMMTNEPYMVNYGFSHNAIPPPNGNPPTCYNDPISQQPNVPIQLHNQPQQAHVQSAQPPFIPQPMQLQHPNGMMTPVSYAQPAWMPMPQAQYSVPVFHQAHPTGMSQPLGNSPYRRVSSSWQNLNTVVDEDSPCGAMSRPHTSFRELQRRSSSEPATVSHTARSYPDYTRGCQDDNMNMHSTRCGIPRSILKKQAMFDMYPAFYDPRPSQDMPVNGDHYQSATNHNQSTCLMEQNDTPSEDTSEVSNKDQDLFNLQQFSSQYLSQPKSHTLYPSSQKGAWTVVSQPKLPKKDDTLTHRIRDRTLHVARGSPTPMETTKQPRDLSFLKVQSKSIKRDASVPIYATSAVDQLLFDDSQEQGSIPTSTTSQNSSLGRLEYRHDDTSWSKGNSERYSRTEDYGMSSHRDAQTSQPPQHNRARYMLNGYRQSTDNQISLHTEPQRTSNNLSSLTKQLWRPQDGYQFLGDFSSNDSKTRFAGATTRDTRTDLGPSRIIPAPNTTSSSGYIRPKFPGSSPPSPPQPPPPPPPQQQPQHQTPRKTYRRGDLAKVSRLPPSVTGTSSASSVLPSWNDRSPSPTRHHSREAGTSVNLQNIRSSGDVNPPESAMNLGYRQETTPPNCSHRQIEIPDSRFKMGHMEGHQHTEDSGVAPLQTTLQRKSRSGIMKHLAKTDYSSLNPTVESYKMMMSPSNKSINNTADTERGDRARTTASVSYSAATNQIPASFQRAKTGSDPFNVWGTNT